MDRETRVGEIEGDGDRDGALALRRGVEKGEIS